MKSSVGKPQAKIGVGCLGLSFDLQAAPSLAYSDCTVLVSACLEPMGDCCMYKRVHRHHIQSLIF